MEIRVKKGDKELIFRDSFYNHIDGHEMAEILSIIRRFFEINPKEVKNGKR